MGDISIDRFQLSYSYILRLSQCISVMCIIYEYGNNIFFWSLSSYSIFSFKYFSKENYNLNLAYDLNYLWGNNCPFIVFFHSSSNLCFVNSIYIFQAKPKTWLELEFEISLQPIIFNESLIVKSHWDSPMDINWVLHKYASYPNLSCFLYFILNHLFQTRISILKEYGYWPNSFITDILQAFNWPNSFITDNQWPLHIKLDILIQSKFQSVQMGKI